MQTYPPSPPLPTTLTCSDVDKLSQIIEQAHQSFLKQSHLLPATTSFDILRILSAYRLLYPNSMSVYNWIIFIMRNYNPKTYAEWVNAMHRGKIQITEEQNIIKEDRVRIPSKHNKSDILPNNLRKYSNISTNFTKNNELGSNFEYLNSKSLSNVLKDSCYQSHHSNSLNPPSKLSVFHPSTTNHYISFDPCANKQNLNFSNINPNDTKQTLTCCGQLSKNYDYSRTLQQNHDKTRTPIDQSFVKNITTSNASPFTMKSNLNSTNIVGDKATHSDQTRELMEHEEYDVSKEEWETMNDRATIYYNVNAKMKGMSALLANFMAIEEYREALMKANCFNRQRLQNMAFSCLLENCNQQKEERNQEQNAKRHYRMKSLKKVFKVIYLIYSMREPTAQKVIPVQYKPLNHEFIMFALFNLKRKQDNEDPYKIEGKINRLAEIKDVYKIQEVLQCFGENSSIKVDALQSFLSSYHLSITKKVFSLLKKECNANQTFQNRYANKCMKKCFKTLKNRWIGIREYRKKQMVRQALAKKQLLAKVMKILIEMAYSTKIYSKRCDYIEKKRKFQMKSKYFRILVQKYQTLEQIRIMKIKKIEEANIFFNKFLQKYSFNQIKFNEQLIRENQVRTSIIYQKNLLFSAFTALSKNKFDHQRSAKIYLQSKNKKIANIIKIWKQRTFNSVKLSKLMKAINKITLKLHAMPIILESIQKVKDLIKEEAELLKKSFIQLNLFAKNQTQNREQKYKQLCILRAKQNKKNTIYAICHYTKLTQQEKSSLDRRNKTQSLQNYLRNKSKKSFLQSFRISFKSKLKESLLMNQLKRNIDLKLKKQFLHHLNFNHQIKSNTKCFKEFIKMQKGRNIIFSLLLNRIQIKTLKITNSIKLFEFSIFKKITLNDNLHRKNRITIAKNQYQKQIIKKSFFSLKELLFKSQQLKKMLKNGDSKKKNEKSLRQVFIILKKMRQINKNKKKLAFILIISKLKQHKNQLNPKNQISTTHLKYIFKSLLSNSKKLKSKVIEKQSIKDNVKLLIKTRFLQKLQRFYINNLISKKHEFMALKFRVIKLQYLSFSILKKQTKLQTAAIFKQKQGVPRLATIDTMKRKQRFSTDCAFQ